MLAKVGFSQEFQVLRGDDDKALETMATHNGVPVREAAALLARAACKEARRACTAGAACQLTANISTEAASVGVSGDMSCNQQPDHCQAEQRVPAATDLLAARVEALVASLSLPGQA